jgi:hypothetical protein
MFTMAPVNKPKGDTAMETAQSTLQFLRESVSALVESCTDEGLLDLICKLLLPPEVGYR